MHWRVATLLALCLAISSVNAQYPFSIVHTDVDPFLVTLDNRSTSCSTAVEWSESGGRESYYYADRTTIYEASLSDPSEPVQVIYTGFKFIKGLFYDGDDNKLYVSDFEANMVYVLDLDGETLEPFVGDGDYACTAKGYGTAVSIAGPKDIVRHHDGSAHFIYVCSDCGIIAIIKSDVKTNNIAKGTGPLVFPLSSSKKYDNKPFPTFQCHGLEILDCVLYASFRKPCADRGDVAQITVDAQYGLVASWEYILFSKRGTPSTFEDGAPNKVIAYPEDLAFDIIRGPAQSSSAPNYIYFVDTLNNRLRSISLEDGWVDTVVGNGLLGPTAGSGSDALLANPMTLAGTFDDGISQKILVIGNACPADIDAGCTPTPSPTRTPSRTPTRTPATPTPSRTPTRTPATPTPTPTRTPATPTPTPTRTPATPTPTPTRTPTTPTPTPTRTPATPTPTQTPPTPTPTQTPPTPTPTRTPATPTPTRTPPTPTPTSTPATPTPTQTPPTPTPTSTPATPTPTDTPSSTPTPSEAPTPTTSGRADNTPDIVTFAPPPTDTPIPSDCPRKVINKTTGELVCDPHITSYDGRMNTLFKTGDYVLAVSATTGLKLHARFAYQNIVMHAPYVTAVALQCNYYSGHIEIHPTYIDKNYANLNEFEITEWNDGLSQGFDVMCKGSAFGIGLAKAKSHAINTWHLDLISHLVPGSHMDMVGLLGTPDGDINTDVIGRDGQWFNATRSLSVDESLTWQDTWAVMAEEKLFMSDFDALMDLPPKTDAATDVPTKTVAEEMHMAAMAHGIKMYTNKPMYKAGMKVCMDYGIPMSKLPVCAREWVASDGSIQMVENLVNFYRRYNRPMIHIMSDCPYKHKKEKSSEAASTPSA